VGELETTAALDVNLVEPIHKDVGDFRVGHQWLQRSKSDELVEEAVDQFGRWGKVTLYYGIANTIPQDRLPLRVEGEGIQNLGVDLESKLRAYKVAEFVGRRGLRRRDVFSQHGGALRTRRTATGPVVIALAV
jgi:hypothetical protein